MHFGRGLGVNPNHPITDQDGVRAAYLDINPIDQIL
jgi:hypothetical protein